MHYIYWVIVEFFPSVDVIIPFHRRDNLLREAIASAHASIGVEIHLILVNDSDEEVSPNSLGLKEKDSLLNSFQQGYTSALKVGLESSTSSFVAFLDSDDLTDPHRIKKQIDRIQTDNVDYVSGKLLKFNKTEIISVISSPLGKIPQPLDPRLLLLIGAHGSDSTIVAKGDSIRASWQTHQKFPSSVADYGWLLSAINMGHTMSHEESAIYYYRSHDDQLSRTDSLKAGWELVWPLWKILKSNPDLRTPLFAQTPMSKESSLALAFPAALPKLKREELSAMKTAIEALLVDLSKLDPGSMRLWQKTLWRRYIIAGRFKAASKFEYLPGILVDVIRQKKSGVNIRI
jgi:glycosyltransferase involved in cell wall biosynthesis